MALLASGIGPAVGTDRLYYGTDTRAAALLIGAALAGAAILAQAGGLPATLARSVDPFRR